MSSVLGSLARKIPGVKRVVAQRDALAMDLARMTRAHDDLMAERESLKRRIDHLTSEQDAMRVELDTEAAMREGLLAEKRAIEERIGPLTSEHNGLLAEHNTLVLNSRMAIFETEDYLRDLLRLQIEPLDPRSLVRLRIVTDHPVAVDSSDHKHPRGAANDNTRHPRFVAKCEKIFGAKISHLDLGCAGGGLVWDFVTAGHQSYGVEGSDFSLLHQRAMWRILPENLFTADVTQPFHFVTEAGARQKFRVISAWELLEHLPEESLPRFFGNLRENLAEDGLFVASIATFRDEDPETGAVWHVTVQPSSWWWELFAKHGFERMEGLFEPNDYVRGSGNPRAHDWNAEADPDRGFHVTLRVARS